MRFLPASTSPAQDAQPVQGWRKVRRQAEELLWVLGGKFGLMGANATLMLLLAERLALETYGLLVTVISAQLLISRVVMLGVDAGMIRMRTLPELRQHTSAVVHAGLVVMWYTTAVLVLSALVVAWLWPASAPLRLPLWVLAAIVGGAVGTALVDYSYSFHLAQLYYRAAALVQSGTALARLGMTVGAVWLFPKNAPVIFLSYTSVSFFSGVAQVAALLRRQGQWPTRALVGRLLRYSAWQCVTNVIVVFSLYQGTFLLTVLGYRSATGLFGLGLTLSLGFFAVYNAFIEYLLPRGARVEHIHALPRFLGRACSLAGMLAVAGILVAGLIGRLVPWLLRPELHGVVPIFYWLSASMLLLILQCPFEVACHYLLHPQLVVLTWTLRAISIVLFSIVLMPTKGAMGVALAQLAGTALASLTLLGLVLVQMRSALRVTHSTDLLTAQPE
jgi:O-antigen/teichoic acid export membrane protein